MREIGGMTDAFLETHPSLSPTAISVNSDHPPDPQQCIDELGVTGDSPLNTWTAGKHLDVAAQKGAGKRLDYIYYTGPSSRSNLYERATSTGKLKVEDCKVALTERMPGSGFSYTDHFGVEATFSISNEAQTLTAPNPALAIETLNACIQAMAMGQTFAVKSQKVQLLGFAAALFVAIGLIIGSAFQPVQGVSAVFTFAAVAAAWAATTLFYSGVIWGDWEKREHLQPTVPESTMMTSPGFSSRNLPDNAGIDDLRAAKNSRSAEGQWHCHRAESNLMRTAQNAGI